MSFVQALPYQPKHKIRVVTAASLFDGRDVDELEPELNNRTNGRDDRMAGHTIKRMKVSNMEGGLGYMVVLLVQFRGSY